MSCLHCSTQSTPRIVQSSQPVHSTTSQSHSNSHSSSHSSTRAQRKNVISCVTVGDSDGEGSPGRAHAHLYQQTHVPQHSSQHQQTTQHIKHEPQPQHHVRWASLIQSVNLIISIIVTKINLFYIQFWLLLAITKETIAGQGSVWVQHDQCRNETRTRSWVSCSTSMPCASMQRTTDLSGNIF